MELKDLTPREYQLNILSTAKNHNTLVILGTGLGKTAIALLLAIERIKQYPNSKILFLAPTRPLVNQHLDTFTKHLDLKKEELAVFTGLIKPEVRAELWKDAKIIFSTPQGLSNDIINKKINLEDVSLLILDEVHRCVKDYDYVWIAKQYHKLSKYPRILGLTASPGSDQETITEICKNAFIENIEIRSESDSEIQPYVQEVDIDYITLELPDEFKKIKKYLEDCFNSKLEQLKNWEIISSYSQYSSKKQLLLLQKSIQGELSRGRKDIKLWRGISLIAESLKVQHALELLETQGVTASYSYIKDIFESAKSTKVKAVKNLIQDPNFKSAYIKIEQLYKINVEHPKVEELKKIIEKEIKDNPKAKIIVFNQYRDSAQTLVDMLSKIKDINVKLFIGQQKRKGVGLSQKEQLSILSDFKKSNHNVLVSTSVGEEGLDIVAVDLVIFYEPIPSAIRTIQRRGRTGRQTKGRVIILVTKNTRDESNRWTAHNKEKRMYRIIDTIKNGVKAPEKPKDTTLKDFLTKKKDIKIIADAREKGSRRIKDLNDKGIEVTMETLEVADYILSDRVAVEIKTKEDFLRSIIDKRLINQVKKLRENFERPVLIIEGEEDLYSLRNIHPNAIHGMLSAIAVDFQVPILYTNNQKDTTELLITIAKREQENRDKDFGIRIERKPLTTKEQQEFIIESLPGIGPSLAKSLLTQFKTIKKIVNSDKEDLTKIENIGKKKAEEIKRIIETDYED